MGLVENVNFAGISNRKCYLSLKIVPQDRQDVLGYPLKDNWQKLQGKTFRLDKGYHILKR
jgi:hypothetical protein